MSNDSPRKSATLRATLFDKASVNKNMRATNSIYIFSHIETEKNPWSSRHFDGICRTDVKKTSNARSRDSSPHLSPNEKWSQRTWQWQWLPYWRGNMTPRRERCVGKITSSLGTISITRIHVYTQISYGFISPWKLRLVALGNLAIEGIHNPSDRISSSVLSYLNNSYITYYQKQLENMSLGTSNLFECAMKD